MVRQFPDGAIQEAMMVKRMLALVALAVGALAWMSAPAGALVQCTPATQGVTLCAIVLDYQPLPTGVVNEVTGGATVTTPTQSISGFYGTSYPCLHGLHADGYFVGLESSNCHPTPYGPWCDVVISPPTGFALFAYQLPVDCPNIVPAPPPTL